MNDKPLNFNPDDLAAFDRAPEPGTDDLTAFDNATGVTVVPAGWYLCRLEAGELVTTKSTGKPAFRLRFLVVEPAAHAGFTLWRYYLPVANPDQTKAALAPLGLRTSPDLRRKPFPDPGRVILCRVLVGIQKDDPTRNDVVRFIVERDEFPAAPPGAGRFALPPDAGEGGGA